MPRAPASLSPAYPGTSSNVAITAVRQLFSAHIAEIRAATNDNYVLGNNRFKEEISRMLKRRVTRGKTGRPGRPVRSNRVWG